MSSEGEHTIARWLGTQAYAATATAMRDWTSARGPCTLDELWFLEHPRTYTLTTGKREHVIGDIGEIPLVESDRADKSLSRAGRSPTPWSMSLASVPVFGRW